MAIKNIFDRMRGWPSEGEHYLWNLAALLRRNSLAHRVLVFASVGEVLLLLTWIWWTPSEHLPTPFFVVLGGLALILAASFFLVASNFKSLHDKINEKLAEQLDHEIGKLAASLTQSNLNVASLHIQIEDSRESSPILSPVVPEHVLRLLDEGMHIKDTMASLEKVMQARQRNVQSRLNHIKEEQQRARQAVTAAAGGIFVGYFTYEAGDAVLKFMHVRGQADDRDLQYWLWTNVGPQAASITHSGAEHLNEHYENHFYKHELHGQAGLLTVTLLVSLLAAWLGWRKPPEERAGGHGGHH